MSGSRRLWISTRVSFFLSVVLDPKSRTRRANRLDFPPAFFFDSPPQFHPVDAEGPAPGLGDLDLPILLAFFPAADQLAERRFTVVELLFDDELIEAVLVDRELDVPVPDVHEPRVVIDQSIAREQSPLLAVFRAVHSDAMLIVDKRRSNRRPARARGLFVERNDDLQRLPFVHVQRCDRAGAGFTDVDGPALCGRLQQVGNLRALIVPDSQVGIAIACRSVDFAVEGDGQDLLAGRGAPIQVLPESHSRLPIRGRRGERQPEAERHSESSVHGVAPWSSDVMALANVWRYFRYRNAPLRMRTPSRMNAMIR